MSGDERVGIKGPVDSHIEDEEEGDITFHVTTPEGKDLQMLKLTPNGDFYVRGEMVKNDIEVFQAFKEWLKQASVQGDKDRVRRADH